MGMVVLRLGVALMLVSVVAWGQLLDLPRLDDLLADADSNGDGEVSLEEAQALVPGLFDEVFHRLDRNGDGVLSTADIGERTPEDPLARLWHLLGEADSDDNGEVTLEELEAVLGAFPVAAFEYLDRNGDGVLSEADLPLGPPAEPREYLLRLLRDVDINGDGAVTFEELVVHVPELTEDDFDRLDLNGDGVLSRDDLLTLDDGGHDRLLHLLREADADENGEVSFAELSVVLPDLTVDRFEHLDLNGDGVLSVADVRDVVEDPRERLLRLLGEADADDNGEISFEELRAVLPGLTAEQFEHLDQNGDGVLSLADIGDTPIPVDDVTRGHLLARLMAADANHDGVLDFTEIAAWFPDAPAELLGHIDSNGDWEITRAELMAALAAAADGQLLVVLSDVDADGAVNSIDVQVTVNHVLQGGGAILPPDADGDGRVGASDIQLVINALLSGGR